MSELGNNQERRNEVDRKRFVELVEAALNVPEGTIREGARLQGLEGWDSMGILSLIAVVDKHYNVNLDPSSLAKCETIDDLARLVQDGSELK
jgi:acyl carrier protein